MSDGREPAAPRVAVVMGSDSDLPVMRAAIDALDEFGVENEVRILSAHRTPDAMLAFAHEAAGRGLQVIIAGAGGAAHLPGMIASATPLPVIGVPVPTTQLAGIDALLSIAQMPAGVPVATVAIGNGRNAGLLAVRMLAASDALLRDAMEQFQTRLAATVRDKDANVQRELRAERAAKINQQP
ncbi:MAG: 5-(carboxyamino)imidazole ribonucleotide mutase [Thermomicrobiales bacterium]